MGVPASLPSSLIVAFGVFGSGSVTAPATDQRCRKAGRRRHCVDCRCDRQRRRGRSSAAAGACEWA